MTHRVRANENERIELSLKVDEDLRLEGMSLPNGLPEDTKAAYSSNLKAHAVGVPRTEIVQIYTDWANTYDEELCSGRYNGPEIAAAVLAEYYNEKERKEVKVIDVAAGTGRIGQSLNSLGFTIVDALEPSEGMLEKAKERNVYRNLICETIGDKPTSIPDDTYDCLVISGGMGEGHIPTVGLNEMIRIVKPGGMICIVMRKEYLSYVTDYAGKLEPYMTELEKKKLWTQISRNEVPNYSFNKDGVIFKFQVL